MRHDRSEQADLAEYGSQDRRCQKDQQRIHRFHGIHGAEGARLDMPQGPIMGPEGLSIASVDIAQPPLSLHAEMRLHKGRSAATAEARHGC